MADSYWIIPPDSTGKKLDAEQLTVGGFAVQRQRVVALTSAQIAAGLGNYYLAASPDITCAATGTAMVVLENPSASGKRIFMDRFIGGTGGTGVWTATLNATRTGGDLLTPTNASGSGNASASVFATGAISAIVLTGGTVIWRDRKQTAATAAEFGGVLQLPAGSSLALSYAPQAAAPATVNFAWWEV